MGFLFPTVRSVNTGFMPALMNTLVMATLMRTGVGTVMVRGIGTGMGMMRGVVM